MFKKLIEKYRRWRDSRLFRKIYFIRLRVVKDTNAYQNAERDFAFIKARWYFKFMKEAASRYRA